MTEREGFKKLLEEFQQELHKEIEKLMYQSVEIEKRYAYGAEEIRKIAQRLENIKEIAKEAENLLYKKRET